MKKVVTLSILGLIATVMPALACGDKDCEHSKGQKSEACESHKPLKAASKPNSEEKVEAAKAASAAESK